MTDTESGARVTGGSSLRARLARLLNDREMFGWRRSLQHALVSVLSRTRDDFDEKYGVATAGYVARSEAEIADPVAFKSALDYVPTEGAVIRHILGYVSRHLEPAEYTFVDLGCGKGRALLLAAELPFREVVGVEISASLCRVAEQNIARQTVWQGNGASHRKASARRARLRANIRVAHADASQFEFPETDLLVYLYNPFGGAVLRAVLDRLAALQARTQRRIDLILLCPLSVDSFESHAAYRLRYHFQAIHVHHSWMWWSCQPQPECSAADGSGEPQNVDRGGVPAGLG